MPDNQYHYAFDADYSGIPREIFTEVSIFPTPTHQDTKGVKIKAVWDTGATHSSLSPKIANELGLKPIDTAVVHGVNSSKETYIVLASIGLPNDLLFTGRRFSVCEIPGADVLIGMDIIMLGDFAISNGGGKTRFSYAMPPFQNKVSFSEKADSINNRLSRNKN